MHTAWGASVDMIKTVCFLHLAISIFLAQWPPAVDGQTVHTNETIPDHEMAIQGNMSISSGNASLILSAAVSLEWAFGGFQFSAQFHNDRPLLAGRSLCQGVDALVALLTRTERRESWPTGTRLVYYDHNIRIEIDWLNNKLTWTNPRSVTALRAFRESCPQSLRADYYRTTLSLRSNLQEEGMRLTVSPATDPQTETVPLPVGGTVLKTTVYPSDHLQQSDIERLLNAVCRNIRRSPGQSVGSYKAYFAENAYLFFDNLGSSSGATVLAAMSTLQQRLATATLESGLRATILPVSNANFVLGELGSQVQLLMDKSQQ